MKKKGLTIVELLIAITLIGIIMGAVASIFVVGIKNYRLESHKTAMQKELNFVSDDIGVNVKQAAEVPASYDSYTRDNQHLILALPAIYENQDFIYSGQDLLHDYYIYYLDSGSVYKVVIPDDSSSREQRNSEVLSSVSNFDCEPTPTLDPEQVTCSIELSRDVSGSTVTISSEKTSNLRNKR